MLSLISACFSLLKVFIQWASEKRLIDLGAAQAALGALQQAEKEIERGKKARLEQRRLNDLDPSGGLSDDKFKRPDDDS